MAESHDADPDWVSYVDAASLAGRSVTWVRTAANRGHLRRRTDPGARGRTWVVRADVERLAAARRAHGERELQRKVPPAPPGSMTLVDAAHALGAAYHTVSRWLLAGRLVVHTRRHPYTYIDEASVRALVSELYDGHDPAELMTYTQAAAQLGVTIQALRRLVRIGELSTVGVGRGTRVSRVQVDKLVSRRTIAADG